MRRARRRPPRPPRLPRPPRPRPRPPPRRAARADCDLSPAAGRPGPAAPVGSDRPQPRQSRCRVLHSARRETGRAAPRVTPALSGPCLARPPRPWEARHRRPARPPPPPLPPAPPPRQQQLQRAD
eukprot:scaffold107430_cov30-Phaeocystis_antarctica.AAC.1